MLRGAAAAACLAVAVVAEGQVATTSPGVEYRLLALPGDQITPAISSSYVPFTDLGASPSRIGVFLLTGSLAYVPGGVGARHDPAVAAPVLAFVEDGPPAQVWTYDLVGGSLVQVSPSTADQQRPTVGTNLIAWEDYRGGGPHVRVKDLLLGKEYRLGGSGTQGQPRASGRRIVYVDAGAGSAVKLYDADAGTTTTIFAGPAAAADVDGNQVVVAAGSPDLDILLFTSTGVQTGRLALPGDQTNPRVSQSLVAFEDLSSGTRRIVVWDLGSARLLAPSPGTSTQALGDVDYPRVVYSDDRSGNFDVYLYDPTGSTPQPPPPSPADGGTADGGAADGGSGTDGGTCVHRRHHHHRHGREDRDHAGPGANGDGWGGSEGDDRVDGGCGPGDDEDCERGDGWRSEDDGDDDCDRPGFPAQAPGSVAPDGGKASGGRAVLPYFPGGCGGGIGASIAVALAGLLPRRRRVGRS